MDPTKWEARRRYYAGEGGVGVAASEKGGFLREEADWAAESKARAEQNGDGLDAMNPMVRFRHKCILYLFYVYIYLYIRYH